jgi:hypothetical protein
MFGFWVAAALLGLAEPQAQANAPPRLWSGDFGFENVAPPVVPKPGEIHEGDVLARLVTRPSRGARLTEAYTFGQGDEAVMIPAGTPFYASLYPVIQAFGSKPLPERRGNDLTWCVAASSPPYACFRWNAPGKVEFARATSEIVRHRRPFRDWADAPEPRLKEDVVPVVASEELVTVKSIVEGGVVLTVTEREGPIESSKERTYYWGQSVGYPGSWSPSSPGELSFSALKDARGRVIGATAALKPR